MRNIESQSSLKVVPPIVLDENGDVQAFATVEAVTRYVEIVDVLKNEYAFYDSTGRMLEPRVDKHKVILVPTLRLEAESPVVRRHVLQVLRSLGVKEDAFSSAPFSELARLLLEKTEKRR